MNIQKNINNFYNLGYTYFLNLADLKEVTKHLKNYHIYKPYLDSEKVIVYDKKIPKVYLYEIKSKIKLSHRQILGSVFSLGISDQTFGDIIVTDKYYIYVLDIVNDYFISNFNYVGRNKISLEEYPIDYLENYQRKYIDHEIIVSSLRADTVISKIIHTNRDKVIEKMKNKEIYLNYSLLKDKSKKLKENDIFSIRRYGKYKFIGIVNKTKKNLVIKYLEYQ